MSAEHIPALINKKKYNIAPQGNISNTSLSSFEFIYSGKTYQINMDQVKNLPQTTTTFLILIYDYVAEGNIYTATGVAQLSLSMTNNLLLYCLPSPVTTVQANINAWFKIMDKSTLQDKWDTLQDKWSTLVSNYKKSLPEASNPTSSWWIWIIIIIIYVITIIVVFFVTKYYTISQL
jgi:hypothetical protein